MSEEKPKCVSTSGVIHLLPAVNNFKIEIVGRVIVATSMKNRTVIGTSAFVYDQTSKVWSKIKGSSKSSLFTPDEYKQLKTDNIKEHLSIIELCEKM